MNMSRLGDDGSLLNLLETEKKISQKKSTAFLSRGIELRKVCNATNTWQQQSSSV
jgi:hypothetical protein